VLKNAKYIQRVFKTSVLILSFMISCIISALIFTIDLINLNTFSVSGACTNLERT